MPVWRKREEGVVTALWLTYWWHHVLNGVDGHIGELPGCCCWCLRIDGPFGFKLCSCLCFCCCRGSLACCRQQRGQQQEPNEHMGHPWHGSSQGRKSKVIAGPGCSPAHKSTSSALITWLLPWLFKDSSPTISSEDRTLCCIGDGNSRMVGAVAGPHLHVAALHTMSTVAHLRPHWRCCCCVPCHLCMVLSPCTSTSSV